MGLVGTGWLAGQIPNDPEKTDKKTLEWRHTMMVGHETAGTLMLAAIFPRIGLRLLQRAPKPLPGPLIERAAGALSHAVLYAAMVFMPLSGLLFGVASGWGIYFVGLDAPLSNMQWIFGPEENAKAIEKFFYENHHRVGTWLEYLVPLHIGAVGYHHLFRGHNLLARMGITGVPVAGGAAKGAASTAAKEGVKKM